MTEPLMPELEFIADDALAGFRLMRVEIYNWGTFDKDIHVLLLDGRNSLLTGDQGSGKSTLVDALTTLLVAPARISYNKAAGAERQERSLRTYVLGHHKTERVETSLKGKPVALRGHNSYSVILGVFHNAGNQETVTLAQVYWVKDATSTPERFYVMAMRDLSISEHFTQFGSEMGQLRKRLKGLGAEIESSFPPYSHWFRRRFGISNEQAMDLFHQTVSLKTVGSLTEFVRTHMLEPFDVAPRIAALINHFDDLSRAHEAVLKAQRQVTLLEPIVQDSEKHAEITGEINQLEVQRLMLKPFFASKKVDLLVERIDHLERSWNALGEVLDGLEGEQKNKQKDVDALKAAIYQNGGDRLQQLKLKKDERTRERKDREVRAQAYEKLTQELGEPSAARDEAGFTEQRNRLVAQRAQIEAESNRCQAKAEEAGIALLVERGHHKELATELVSLKARRSNIPGTQVNIRQALCRTLGVAEDELPFVGELIQVREEEKDWEGAAERVLHSFGLSLVVPEEHYRGVVAYVDENNLKGRLVYLRVGAKAALRRQEIAAASPHSLVRKLSINPESAHVTWLERTLSQRFDLVCCQDQDQFRREERAITQAGQIKTSAERHEKDDRFAIDDRRNYVLGWSNAAKIDALERQREALETKIVGLMKVVSDAQSAGAALRRREAALVGIDQYPSYSTIDWRSVAQEIVGLTQDISAIEKASNLLNKLNEDLGKAETALTELAERIKEKNKEAGNLEARLNAAGAAKDEAEKLVKALPETEAERLQAMLGDLRLTVENCASREEDLREKIQNRLGSKREQQKLLRDRVTAAMVSFRNEFRLETAEFDANVDASEEYRAMLGRLRSDDLPRFVAKFKQLLNEETINEIAKFAANLERERETIKEKMQQINQSLTKLDYNPGRYIMLDAQVTQDPDVRDFQSEIRACIEGGLTGTEDSPYSDAKFLRVKQLIDRFQGRVGQADQDKAWAAKVTDVRNWFVFAANELWREDDRLHEYYPDAGGKSGGQKEKLAYTVLAASLAYQFGLEADNVRSRTFRFVVIDEAFGKGTDESAHYALTLFTQLNLQVLVVTPLQKIHVIEPFVSSVGFVHNENGNSSRLRNLSIEEYLALKAEVSA